MRSEVFRGRYLFHFHTAATDGRPSVADYFRHAEARGFERLVFLEHIRRRPGYDVPAYRREVEACARASGLAAFVGFEAKLLPDGELDIAPEHAALADVIGVAEHGFPPDLGVLRAAFATAATAYRGRYPDKEIVWVHPGAWFKKQGRLEECRDVYLAMIAEAQRLGLRVERNLRHGLIPRGLVGAVAPDRLTLGVDAHDLDDIDRALGSLEDAYRRHAPAAGPRPRPAPRAAPAL